jgi:hypothetical protein
MAIDREPVIACADQAPIPACRGIVGTLRIRGAFCKMALVLCLAVSPPISGAMIAIPAVAQTATEIQRAANDLAKQLDLQTELPAPSREPEKGWSGSLDDIRIFLWIAVICGAAALAYFIRGILPAGGLARRSDWDDPSEPSAFGETQGGAQAQATADELARQGRFVEAIHVLLLQGLDEMRRRLDQRFADSLTSREIMRRAKVSANARAALRDIVDWVERAYFGAHPAVAEDYAACRKSFVAFAEALKEGAAT